ncbi:MAG: metallophosphoesterase family protein [Clostridia bacterium]|jgi:exonuclease SbcD
MNYLFFGDPHIRYKRPENRKEGFYEQLKEKLREVKSIAKKFEIKETFCLGDLFDNEASLFFNFLMYDISDYLQGYNTLIGNHDSKLKSLETRGTMLGVLEKHGIVKIPKEDLIIGNVLFRFAHYPIKDQVSHECNFNGIKVMLSHDVILPPSESKDIRYEFKETNKLKTDFDLYILGHYHFPFSEKVVCEGINREKHKVLFYNPGSLLRLTSKEKDYKRKPKVAILFTDDNNSSFSLKEIDLECALDYKEVYDFDIIEKKKENKEMESKFVKSIKENLNESYNKEETIISHIKKISQDKEVNDYVSGKIEQYNSSKSINK